MTNKPEFVVKNGVLTRYNGPGGDVVIPEGVTKIREDVFFEEALTGVVIPEGVTDIGTAAFSGCGGLTCITIPKSVGRIGALAFANCANLKDVFLQEGLQTILWSAFGDCPKLENICIPDSVTYLDYSAFLYCPNLTSVVLQGKQLEFPQGAFYDKEPRALLEWRIQTLPFHAVPAKEKPYYVTVFSQMYLEKKPFAPSVQAAYLKYIRSQRKRLYQTAVQNPALLAVMVQEAVIPKQDFDTVWALAGKQNNEKLMAMLQNYAHKKEKGDVRFE